MCGILAIFGFKGTYLEARRLAVKLSRRIKHRGPDESGIFIEETPEGINIICQERLAIVDISEHGRQPFVNNDKKFVFVVNGEIFNYEEIKKKYGNDYHFAGHSDSEAIGVLYQKYQSDFANKLEGMFSIVIYDMYSKKYYIYRDHAGIIPLYTGESPKGERYVCSELKGIHDMCETVELFEAGCMMSNDGVYNKWYQPNWINMDYIPRNPFKYEELKQQMIDAVKAQLLGDVPFGVLLSGGLDSSLIASIVMRLVKNGEIDIKSRGMSHVHSFAIGLEGSPDLKYAKQVAEFIGTNHVELYFTVEEGIDHYPEVIYHVETFNPTTIRASVPMYIMSRKIKAHGIKVVITGEGADEIFGGYLYFHKAPNAEELHKELVRKVLDLPKYDLLRSNKSTMAWGVEVRPPFMHLPFLNYAMNIDPELKLTRNNERKIEKYILRKAFDDPNEPWLPEEVLWRQKEQFSDGVGYKWIDGIKDLSEKVITNHMWEQKEHYFPFRPPFSKEMFMVRQIFNSYFPTDTCALTVGYQKSVACSTEKALEWDESFKKSQDESGRSVLGIHIDAKPM